MRQAEPVPESTLKKRVLLTGATGYIAGQLLPEFRERYDLRLVDVRPGDGVEVADLLAGAAGDLGRLFEGVDVVVHTAYHRPAGDDPQARYDGERRNVDMMQRVYQLALDHGVRRVVAASTNQAAKWYEQPYFQGLRDRVTPDDYPRPDNFYGWAKAAYESLGFLYACGSLGRKLEVIQLRIVVPREIDAGKFVDQPAHRYVRELAGYISERDLRQLFARSIEAGDIDDEHGVPFHIFYGVSDNARTFWSITNARRVIGYQPQDDSERRFAADIARLLGG
ncbi:NAD-dependent epimerase/dehydratase family protein [Actinopolymorpha alba]|uniref:NAD-dependent epimerase/dehydratase family protein n=1 Tax=Actinopolymorpha alba TaxID=533267 RepID=UPI00036B2C66|nr:NAD(P)-dependent oxidoreductase [Actinopolymorpha alba]